jgi:hypothetical protein
MVLEAGKSSTALALVRAFLMHHPMVESRNAKGRERE